MKLSFKYLSSYDLDSFGKQKYDKILDMIKDNYIVLIDGNFSKDDEIQLLRKTMEMIGPKFKGIEFASFDSQSKKNLGFFKNVRYKLANWISGGQGVTLIGRSEIIKDIKKDPSKLELVTSSK